MVESVIVYSTSSAGTVTSTGFRPVEVVAPRYVEEPEPHCFVCRRHTDHIAEHDALVEHGLAEYDYDRWVVRRTDLWDDARASAISEAEYQRLYGHLDLT